MGVLTQTAQIMCMHGGQVTIIPKPHPITVLGIPLLFAPDLLGCPIVGCANVPTPAGTAPCLTVAAPPLNWANPLATFLGLPLLNFMPGIPGGMAAGSPGGPLICVNPGQTLIP